MQSLWNARRILWWATFCGLLLSTLFAFLIPNRYESVAHVMAPGKADSDGLMIGILQSRTVQDSLIDRFDLKKVYWDKTWDDARTDLKQRTEFSDRGLGIITIRVQDRSPDRAAAMAQAFVDKLNSVASRVDIDAAHHERTFLEARLTQAEKNLESSEMRFSEFSRKTLMMPMDEQSTGMLVISGDDSDQTDNDQTDMESLYTDADEQNGGSEGMGTLLDVPLRDIGGIQNQLIAEKSELNGMKRTYADASVQIRSKDARVNHLQREFDEQTGYAGIAPSPEGRAQRLYPTIRELPLLGTIYGELTRNVGLDDMLVSILSQENENSKIAEVQDTPHVEVLDPPDVPEEKSWPPRFWIVLLGGLCSFFLAVGWISIVRTTLLREFTASV